MADHAEDLRQADLAKLPLFSGDKTDIFTCEQWISRVQRAKDSSGWTNARTMTYVLNALRGSAFAYTRSINLAAGVDIDNWDSFKAALLDSFSIVRTSRTTTVNISTLIQGQTERVINYYIRVADSINDMASLKKLHQQRVPANPFGPILGALPEVVATDVAVRAQVCVDLVNFGVQDCYDNIALHLFVSGLRPNIRDEVMRQSPITLTEAKAFASDAEKRATIPQSKTSGATSIPVMPVDDNDTADSAETEAELVAALEEAEKSQDCKIAVLKAKINRFRRNPQTPRPANPGPSSSGPRPPRKAPNPAAKNIDCRYCGRKGHFQLDCNDRKRAGAPMVGSNGVPYSQRPAAAVDSNGQAHANTAALFATAPPPVANPGQVVYQPNPYANPNLGYYQSAPSGFH
jgi:hypothetical protein